MCTRIKQTQHQNNPRINFGSDLIESSNPKISNRFRLATSGMYKIIQPEHSFLGTQYDRCSSFDDHEFMIYFIS